MFIAVAMQFVAVVLASLVAGVATDWTNARFLFLGGASAMIPNGLFALRLALHRKRPPESYPVVFFLGELIKIVATVLLLAWVARPYDQARWLPLLIGFIVALKAPLAAPFLEERLKARPGRGRQGGAS